MAASRSSLVLLSGLSLVWGSGWIANRVLASLAPPVHLLVLRYLLAFVVLGAVVLIRRLASRVRRRRDRDVACSFTPPGMTAPRAEGLPALATLRALDLPSVASWHARGANLLLGCTMFAVPDLLLVAAGNHGAGAFTPLVYAGLPLGLALAAGELQAATMVGLGAMLLLLNGSLHFSPQRLAWAAAIVAAVALQGWSLLYARRHLLAVASIEGCLWQTAAAAWVLTTALQLGVESGTYPPVRSWPAGALLALSSLAIAGTALAYPLFYGLLRRISPAQLASTAWLQTLVAAAEGALLLRQRPDLSMLAAALVLLACAGRLGAGGSNEATQSLMTPGSDPV